MKQQFTRDWLQDYRHIPRRNSYLQNYFNMAPVKPSTGATGNSPIFNNVGNEDYINQRQEEGIAAGEKAWLDEMKPMFSNLPQQYRSMSPGELLPILTNFYQQNTADTFQGVPMADLAKYKHDPTKKVDYKAILNIRPNPQAAVQTHPNVRNPVQPNRPMVVSREQTSTPRGQVWLPQTVRQMPISRGYVPTQSHIVKK